MKLSPIYSDIEEFEKIACSNRTITNDTIEQYVNTLSIHKGEFLEGNDYLWSSFKKELYVNHFVTLAKTLVNYFVERGNYTEAIVTIRKILVISPLDESTHELLLELYLLNKDRVSFIYHYHSMVRAAGY